MRFGHETLAPALRMVCNCRILLARRASEGFQHDGYRVKISTFKELSMRSFAALVLFPLVALAQPTFPTPKTYPPNEKTLNEIKAKTEELEAAIAKLPKDVSEQGYAASVKVFHKAAVWIVRHGEWYTDKSGQQTLEVLEAGLERAKALAEGKRPWFDIRNKPIALGYRSHVDDSIQPFSVRYPDNFDPKKKYRLDVVLHGRDSTLTEVKFLHGKEFAKPGKGTDYFVMEVYGRGNNAYRWAGEEDIIEAISWTGDLLNAHVDPKQIVLRGFSMGGAGTWHFGLHHPDVFAAMQPGAGFSATRGYHKGLEANPPDYIIKGLHIYDAVDYAENCFNIPIVAYSGSKDPQKLAADNIEAALKNFKEPHSFTHIVAPDLEHKQPAEWWAKCDTEIRRHLQTNAKSEIPERIRFVTYTAKYRHCGWLRIDGLDEHYAKATVDASLKDGKVIATTTNVRRIEFYNRRGAKIDSVTLDGQAMKPGETQFQKKAGKWIDGIGHEEKEKTHDLQGPIDDAFTWEFGVFGPTGVPWHDDNHRFIEATRTNFAAIWDKYFRGEFSKKWKPGPSPKGEITPRFNSILFGDPQSNPEIARLLPNWPITWTKDKLVVNGVEYDAKTHVPMMIYPKSYKNGGFGYAVLNSGHTFREADLKGSNVLLYPRLGDWAVVKPKPTKADPGAYEVVAAGMFDEFWQFPKKK